MEAGETAEEGAVREAREEAHVDVDPGGLELLSVVTAHRHAIVVITFAGATTSVGEAGHEVSEVGWFVPEAIPWRELAFDSTEAPLREWVRRRGLPLPDRWFTHWDG